MKMSRNGTTMMKKYLVVAAFTVCAIVAGLLFLPAATNHYSQAAEPAGKTKTPREVSFARDIKPILAGKCFTCHGPDSEQRKARLRLDVEKEAKKKLRSGYFAIVPGHPEKSELVARVFAKDPHDRMPPMKSKLTLSEKEKQLLKSWVEQGAQYEKHWAFVPPHRPVLPMVKNKRWPKNVIDYFILAKLEKKGLKPAPEADRYTLARRVAIDLTGLPPTLETVERFVKDKRPDAYERYVDQLLDSPAYGERWAATWLDLARYADSSGYAEDNPRVIWMYRDWVIRAINKDMPFDRFTILQLAGDLLPNPTREQLIATAFHRNTPSNDEGGTDDEEFRTAAIVDRVNTTMQVWMGMTMGCAQCHNHKYDPLLQEEYFNLYAIFNQSEDSDKRDMRPTLVVFTKQQKEQKKQLEHKIAALERIIAAKEVKAPKAKVQRPTGPLQTRFVRIEHMGKKAILSLAEVQAFAGGKNVATSRKAKQSSVDYNGPARLAIDGNTNGDYFEAKSTTHTKTENQPWWEVDLGKAHVLERIAVWNRTDGSTGARLKPFRVVALDAQRKPLWVKTIKSAPNPSVTLKLPSSAEKLGKAELAELARYGAPRGVAGAERRQLSALKKQLARMKGIPTPIMRELPAKQQRKTHILIRGNFLDKGKQVDPGVPAVFHPLKAKNIDRLALAKWLVDPKNPLTARVTVNRYWEQIFGKGLVETSEDFGIRGKLPTHPELLDWLAVEFMEQKWDVKKLVKMIVTSATYRQSSKVTPAMLEQDPHNRLYTRGPRVRASAEVIRDQALFVSGLLSKKMYGPPARPPRPNFGLRAAFGGATDWKTSPGADRYRRAVYTEWRRSIPYPSMVTFDAQNRNVCVIKRPVTNTPLQPLVTMNDPVYVECAQALARRMVKEGGKSIEEKAAHGFRLCLIRPPHQEEVRRLVSLYQTARAMYDKDQKAAQKLATEPIGPLPEGISAAEMAAWTVVGNVLLNLDEMFLKR